jgi:K+-transporting ATPase ATPase C chain
MQANLRSMLVLFFGLTALTGGAYPLLVNGLAQLLFPGPANGGLIREGERVVGARPIGQVFTGAGYFHGRPSALSPAYDAKTSGGSNLGPTNPALLAAVTFRVEALQAENPKRSGAIPVELVTTSASGLDPDLSPAGAMYQVPRIAEARQLPEAAVYALINEVQELPLFGIFGEVRVNVLALNLALDRKAAPGASR